MEWFVINGTRVDSRRSEFDKIMSEFEGWYLSGSILTVKSCDLYVIKDMMCKNDFI